MTERDVPLDPQRGDGLTVPVPHGIAHEPHRRAAPDPLLQVRSSDLEPYTGLRYLSKLFRAIALLLVLALVAEVVTGVLTQGAIAVPRLVGEASRLIVLAGLLWGIGDVVLLLVDVGHDQRASRILLARVAHYLAQRPEPPPR